MHRPPIPGAAYVTARVNGRRCHCLLDSGADISLIPSHFVDSALLREPHHNRLFAANDTEITVDGLVTVPVLINKRKLPTPFFASSNVDEVILGRDFLTQNRVVWDFNADSMCIDGCQIRLTRKGHTGPRCRRCRVGSDVVIPPHSEAIITTNVIFGNFRNIAEEMHWTTVPSEPVQGLRVARTLVPSERPIAAVRVCNITPRPIVLRKGQSVSTLQNVQIAAAASPVEIDQLDAAQQRRNITDNVDPSVPENTKSELAQLVDEYQDIFSYSEYDLGSTDLVQHEIHTGDNRPFKQALRPQPRARLPDIDNLLASMEAQGVIERCQSDWASNIVLVTKKDGSIRFCVDYRKLNSLTQRDVYPLPRIETCLDTLSGAVYFSTFDLRSGFHQVKVHPRDVNKTTFTCHRGTFRFPRMPFGLTNAPATFQRLMDTVLMGLNFDICLAYLDDIILYSKDISSHLDRLKQLFQRLREANLKLKPSKCVLMQKRVAFLGYTVSGEGISTDASKIEAVRDWPTPANLKQCRSFIGLCQYYRRFVPKFSEIAAPLYALTKKGVPFVWTPQCQAAFDQLKSSLISADVLALPSDEGEYILDTDASDVAMGGVLSIVQDGVERPVCYASQLFDKHQKNYSVTRKEMLALVTFVKKFRQYLLGRHFLIRTDHAALTWLRRTPEPIGQQARWLEILEEFDFRVEHRPGAKHCNADALSRIVAVTRTMPDDTAPATSVPQPPILPAADDNTHDTNPSDSDARTTDHVDWSAAQQTDPVVGEIFHWVNSDSVRPQPGSITDRSAEFKTLAAQFERLVIHNGILYRTAYCEDTGQQLRQIVVPASLRKQISDQYHRGLNGGHLGHRRSRILLSKRFYWPGLSRDVYLAKHRCEECERHQRPRPRRQGHMQPMVVGEPWERIGIDVTGPHPTSSKGHSYILTVIDHFTKWVEIFPMRNQEAHTVAKILFERVICVHGVPIQILSDQGSNFESALFQELCRLMGVDKIRTSPYRPATNGNIERFHGTMHSMLAKLVSENQKDWDLRLPVVAFAYRTSVQEATKFTPFFLMYGREARLPADLIYGPPPTQDELPTTAEYAGVLCDRLREAHALTRRHLGTAARRRKHQYDLRSRARSFDVGSWVWVFVPRKATGRYTKWRSLYQGPFQVIKKLGDVTYVVQRSNRTKPWTVHVDKLKPCTRSDGPQEITTDRVERENAPASPDPITSRPRRRTRVPARYRDD